MFGHRLYILKLMGLRKSNLTLRYLCKSFSLGVAGDSASNSNFSKLLEFSETCRAMKFIAY